MVTATRSLEASHAIQGFGTRIPFDAIHEPGCYVCTWSGHLLRMPDDAVAPGRSPTMEMLGHDPLFVTRISDNPFITVSKARLLAADCDVPVNF